MTLNALSLQMGQCKNRRCTLSHDLDHEIKYKGETKSNELFTIALFYGTNKTQ